MKIRTANYRQTQQVEMAISHLRRARDLLIEADSPQAAKKVRSALKSAEGAKRHVDHRFHRAIKAARPEPIGEIPSGVIVFNDTELVRAA